MFTELYSDSLIEMFVGFSFIVVIYIYIADARSLQQQNLRSQKV